MMVVIAEEIQADSNRALKRAAAAVAESFNPKWRIPHSWSDRIFHALQAGRAEGESDSVFRTHLRSGELPATPAL